MLWPETTHRDEHGALTVGGIGLPALAAEYGTPLYVFDEQTVRHRASMAVAAFAEFNVPTRVAYASKALLVPAILAVLHEEGVGFDVASGGELYAGLASGIPPSDITFHGNNKSQQELQEAIEAGVGLIAVDNEYEISLLRSLTAKLGKRVEVLVRINPGVEVHTHEKVATGVTDSKFGFPIWTGAAKAAVSKILATPGLDLAGYHAHIGSQIFEFEAYELTIAALLNFAAAVRDEYGFVPCIFSPGGGIGIAYEANEEEVSLRDWAAVVTKALIDGCASRNLPLPELVVEPGRSIVGPSAVAVYTVGAIKDIPGVRTYVSVDGGMADNIRPSLYGARYSASVANRITRSTGNVVTVAGKYCESGDILIRDVDLGDVTSGDLVALPAVGAYCLAMASNYNLALRPAVVLVQRGEPTLVRRRERYDDLLDADVLPVKTGLSS
ncbi:MAG: diaminopimelate decarboxylase [Thermomicrobiales bacterium]